MKKTLILCSIFLFSITTQSLKAQQRQAKEPVTLVSANEVAGTYLVEFLKSDNVQPVALTSEIYQKIKEGRRDNEVFYIKVNEVCRIKVFPRNTPAANLPKEEFVIVEKFENNQ